jgi:hypothetical protein
VKPRGADQLERMRLSGKRPAGFIVVTEDADIARNARQQDFCSLVFDPAAAHDWRALKGLDVRLVTNLARSAAAPACLAIVDADPVTFCATYFSRHDIEHDWVIRAAR